MDKLPCFNKKKKKEEEDINLAEMAKQYQTDAHKTDKDTLMKSYETDFKNGLKQSQIQKKEEEFGKNMLTPPKETHVILKFLKSLVLDFFNILLEIGALLCFISFGINTSSIENLYLALVLLFVVLATAGFTTYQEYSSNKIMKGFANFLPQQVSVYRDGVMTQRTAADIYPGDIVELKSGDKIPADIVIISCTSDSKVDNSSLTGECEPQQRSMEMTSEDPLETKNLCFFGTLLVQGKAKGMVINTGDKTLMGGIAMLTSKTKSKITPIGKEIKRFVIIISVIAITLGVVLGIINVVLTKDAINTIVFVIGIIVANVPEGLLATLTVSLTLAAKQMSKKSVVVKNLEGVETLGSTSVICSDKTGTLTINKMTVAQIFYDNKERNVDTHDSKIGDFDSSDQSFVKFVRCATLCNNAKFNDKNVIVGDASESALVKFSNPHLTGKTLKEYRDENPCVHSIPFNSKNKWQLSIHKVTEEGHQQNVIVMKGAPERMITFCTKIYVGGQVLPLGDEERKKIEQAILSFARQGERVLGFCELPLETQHYPMDFEFKGELPESANFMFKDFVFIGLSAMIDPPRPSVPNSVHLCQSAGIRVFMVTGDHPTTARAIATKVHILDPHKAVFDLNEMENPTLEDIEGSNAKGCVVTGRHINQFIEGVSEEEVTRFWNSVLVHQNVVFSRTSPQHKLLIVEACQRRNSIVAVTGDGVNDSPALKKADIGIAMGITGTDVAKDAADMILLDDNFSSIVNGVQEGRILFDNLKKSIAYTLSSNIPEIMPFIVNIFFGWPIPLRTVQIFTIDLGTDMVPAISMAYEKKEADIMKRMPRNPRVDRLVTRVLVCFSYLLIGMMQMFAGLVTYFIVFYSFGFPFKYLYKLDNKSEFFVCTDNNKYLSCSNTLLSNNRYCIYTPTVITDNTSIYTILNLDCASRNKILSQANAAYVLSIVIVQIADVMISKTRSNSVFSQGMGNWLMNLGIVLEVGLISLLIYVPGVQKVFAFQSIPAFFWIIPLPFFVLIFGFDELRKFMVRRNFDGWVKRNTYW